jgi:hypothetical protein
VDSLYSDTKTYYGADWQSSDQEIAQFLGSYTTSCSSLGCSIDPDGLCKCPVSVENIMAFENDSELTVDDIISKAAIGAFQPTIAGEDIQGDDGIKKYPGGPLTPETVFEFTDSHGRTLYRKNILSKVVVGNGGLEMRNPVTFFTLSEYTERDAAYELDAALEQYFIHSNTGRFQRKQYQCQCP